MTLIFGGEHALHVISLGAAWGRLLDPGKEVMSLADRIVTEQKDVATLLGGLACRLRNDGLALTGIACPDSTPGAVEHGDLHELSGSLDRVANLVEAVKERLCRKCRLLNVAELVPFGTVPEA